jgi:mono/diheme cytochrome c family protein
MRRFGRAALRVGASLLLLALVSMRVWAQDRLVDPFLGQPAAIEQGEQQYRAKCIICHGKAGGRGPNLFATRLRDDQFLTTVLNGRPGTLMPVFGLRLSPDDVWKILAFVRAHPDGM